MRPADLARAHPLGAAVAIGALLGALLGALRPVEVGENGPAPELAWRLPAPEAVLRGDERHLASLRQADIWGAGADRGGASARGGSQAAAAAAWRLLGVVTQPEPLALVAGGDGKVERLGVGQSLPDGGKLLEIGDTLVRFERQGCRYQRRLFAATAEPESGDCGDASTPPNNAPDSDR